MSAPEPAEDQQQPGWTEEAPKSKRSQTVSLVLLASAGAAALGVGALDPSQREENVLVYPNVEACIAGNVRSEGDCRSEYAKALAAYPKDAPRYATSAECERHHGGGHCVAGESIANGPSGQFVPRMAAYLIGRKAGQALDAQAVYEHQPAPGSSGGTGYGGYCTRNGSRISTSSGGRASTARVSSSAVRSSAFGGFGSTGRSFSSSSSG